MEMENDVQNHPIMPEEPQKTSDFYKVSPNLPTRFNNPECFHGYRPRHCVFEKLFTFPTTWSSKSQNYCFSKKTNHPLYQTSNQIYGSKRPTVHEMPTRFHGSFRKFSSHMQKSGMFRDNGFNTSPDKSRVIGQDHVTIYHDRLNFQHCFKNQTSGPAV